MATTKELDEKVATLENEIVRLKRHPPKTRLNFQLGDADQFLKDFNRLVLALERFATAFAGPERSFVEVASREVVQSWLDKLKQEQEPKGLWPTVRTFIESAISKPDFPPDRRVQIITLWVNVVKAINFLNVKQVTLNNARTTEVIKRIGQDIFDETSSRVDSISRDLDALINGLGSSAPGRLDLENAQKELEEPKADLSAYLNT